MFYLLSFTWGSPLVLCGSLTAFVLRVCGFRPRKYGWEWCFEIPGIDWGLEMGIFFIVPKDADEKLKMHEHGHGIQNAYLGIFELSVVFIPSAVRFWYRKTKKAAGGNIKTGYSDIWFEKSADESGERFIRGYGTDL